MVDESTHYDGPAEVPSTPETEERPAYGGPAPEHRPSTDWLVFGVAAVLTLGFVAWGATATEGLAAAADSVLGWVITNLGWFFVLTASGFVVFALWLAMSRYGRIPLGEDDAEPEYRTVSWVAMMFSAGMGIGLMFYGVTEPLTHFTAPPPDTVAGSSNPAVETAMATSLFHWTLHPWSIYAVVGLALAYSTFRRGRRQTISAVFTPLFGRRAADGVAGRIVDILAIFATLFGSAASLGLGALQIGSGLNVLGWLTSEGTPLLVGVIAVLTVAFILSAVSGIDRGIQWLSNINMVLAALLAIFLFVVGPTVFVLNLLPTSIGGYFRDLWEMIARTDATGGQATAEWLATWTVFYWAWWISWTPFVGMFIAKISRGRTIRQFVAGVILVPSVVSVVWFAVLGGTAIDVQRDGVDLAGQNSQEAQLFGLLAQFPWATVMSVLVMVLVSIFFVSGADAASIVLGTLSQKGTEHPQRWAVIFWGALTGAVAAIMLLIGGDTALTGLQNLTIIVSVPFVVVMVLLCVSLMRDLNSDPMMVRHAKRQVALDTGEIDRLVNRFQRMVRKG